MAAPEIQILVCTNERGPDATKPSCGPRGGLEVYRQFKDRVRELGVRDRVMVNRTGCLKHCSRGVTVTVWPQNRWFAGVAAEDVEAILQEALGGPGSSKDTLPNLGWQERLERLAMPDIPWE